MAQWVKNPPAMHKTQETKVPSMSREHPLEKEMSSHSSISGWRIPWTEEPGRLQFMICFLSLLISLLLLSWVDFATVELFQSDLNNS